MIRRNFGQIHEKVMSTLKYIYLEDKCVSVSVLAQETELDSRVVRRHLKVIEIDGFGYFADRHHTIFCKK